MMKAILIELKPMEDAMHRLCVYTNKMQRHGSSEKDFRKSVTAMRTTVTAMTPELLEGEP